MGADGPQGGLVLVLRRLGVLADGGRERRGISSPESHRWCKIHRSIVWCAQARPSLSMPLPIVVGQDVVEMEIANTRQVAGRNRYQNSTDNPNPFDWVRPGYMY